MIIDSTAGTFQRFQRFYDLGYAQSFNSNFMPVITNIVTLNSKITRQVDLNSRITRQVDLNSKIG